MTATVVELAAVRRARNVRLVPPAEQPRRGSSLTEQLNAIEAIRLAGYHNQPMPIFGPPDNPPAA